MRCDHGDYCIDGIACFKYIWPFRAKCDQYLYHYDIQSARWDRYGRGSWNYDRHYYKLFFCNNNLSVCFLRISLRLAE